jgi:hypothetical protein
MRAQIVSLTLALFFASAALAAPVDSVASRLAAQNALFEEQYQSGRCEKIDFQLLRELGAEKSCSRVP